MKQFLLGLWQLPQNIAGFAISVLFEDVWVVECDDGEDVNVLFMPFFNAGVSLGDFIILDKVWQRVSETRCIRTINHEHGHQKQSRMLGWLYLPLIGLPSMLGNIWDRVAHKDWSYADREKWYYSQPWEAWADRLGGVERW